MIYAWLLLHAIAQITPWVLLGLVTFAVIGALRKARARER